VAFCRHHHLLAVFETMVSIQGLLIHVSSALAKEVPVLGDSRDVHASKGDNNDCA